MRSGKNPDERVLGLLILRLSQGWTQAELAKRVGTSASVISEHESGKRKLSFQRLCQIAEDAGLDGAPERMLPYLRALRASLGSGSPSDLEAEDGTWHGLAARTAELLAAPRKRTAPPIPKDREEAPVLWAHLRPFGVKERRILIDVSEEYQSWALCELLCALSTEDGAEKKELAELALFVAERVPGEEAWRSRIQGYAWAHLGRVLDGETDAEEVRAYARRLWEEGAAGDPGGLLADPAF